MQSKHSKTQLNNLKKVGYGLALLASAKYPGEDFHDGYKKHPEIFRKLVKSDRKLYKGMGEYFSRLTTTVHRKINWSMYSHELMKASVSDMIESDWSDETLTLKVLLTDALKDAIAAGGQMTELDTSIDIGWTAGSKPAIEFLNKYSLKLAGDLSSTTIDLIKSSLKSSLDSGFTQDEASSALNDIIDNDRRASMIAHTESIRAFSEGRLAVADEVGADRKQWDATGGACDICGTLDGEVVDADAEFSDGSDAPPAHPNCRCLIHILMPNEDPIQNNEE